jgi:signal transduction histidine kinase
MNSTVREPTHSILVVDDAEESLRLLADLLTKHEYAVQVAVDGVSALSIIRHQRPDLILLDVNMPGMDGYQVCQRLKSDRQTRDIPVIFVSSHDDVFNKVKAFQAGAVDYVDKPIQIEELISRISTHLQLHRLMTELQQKNTELAESIDVIKTTQAQLVQSERMAALGRVVAGVSHELRNPMHLVNLFSQLCKRLAGDIEEKLGADGQAATRELLQTLTANLDQIQSNTQRANAIIESMLLYAHRGGTMYKQSVDINTLLQQAIDLAYHSFRADKSGCDIQIHSDLQATLPSLEVTPPSLSRVFINLIENACDAIWSKQQTEPVDYAPQIWISTRAVDNGVIVSIRDNGCGIDPEIKSTIFDPFFSTKPPGQGTGLGLSMVYEIITREHNGSIDIELDADNHPEFIIRLFPS